ncbi:hypothetical protein L208DRAFT_1322849 [Tricholoma matsutake]|nr:hypothetical protein L208DRAFT_1322849 [Tricholoma matsutake 945]
MVGGYKPQGSSLSTNAVSSSSSHKPPHLTKNECSLLFKHQGCLKCRCGYQSHRAMDCPNDFPDGRNYKEVTEDSLLSQKKQMNVPTKSKPVGAVTGSTLQIEEVDEGEDSFVAGAVMPLLVLGAGSETDEVSPLTIPHLRWTCTLIGPGTDEPVAVNTMLDSGMHIILINSALVEKLGLCCFHSHKPFVALIPLPISIALNNTASSESQLYEYIKITPYSVDASWTSRTVKAVITPNLCVPILFGLPFLSINNIVADFKEQTPINKSTSYDLLLPPLPKRQRKWVMPLNVAGMIKERIKVLNFKQTVHDIEHETITEFANIFQPLPHVDKLPWDVTARIKLKNTEHTIKTRTYACPQKFCESWKTLIQQHLDAGQIRPSSSPHASPAFIIPKADASVLPRWVNDYRQLNKNTIADSHLLP